MKRLHSNLLSAFVLTLVCTVTFAQSEGFERYDTNGDGEISKQEFQNQTRRNHSFERLDVNQDRQLDEKEFGEAGIKGEFGMWDTDDSGYVDENEFYGTTFDRYDSDQDSYWDGGEWGEAIEGGWFGV